METCHRALVDAELRVRIDGQKRALLRDLNSYNFVYRIEYLYNDEEIAKAHKCAGSELLK